MDWLRKVWKRRPDQVLATGAALFIAVGAAIVERLAGLSPPIRQSIALLLAACAVGMLLTTIWLGGRPRKWGIRPTLVAASSLATIGLSAWLTAQPAAPAITQPPGPAAASPEVVALADGITMWVDGVFPNTSLVGVGRTQVNLRVDSQGRSQFVLDFYSTDVVVHDDLGHTYSAESVGGVPHPVTTGPWGFLYIDVHGTPSQRAHVWTVVFQRLSGRTDVRIGYDLRGG